MAKKNKGWPVAGDRVRVHFNIPPAREVRDRNGVLLKIAGYYGPRPAIGYVLRAPDDERRTANKPNPKKPPPKEPYEAPPENAARSKNLVDVATYFVMTKDGPVGVTAEEAGGDGVIMAVLERIPRRDPGAADFGARKGFSGNPFEFEDA